MKHDKEKIKRIRECLNLFYLTVSDKDIADKFGVAVASVRKARHRLGLKKSGELATGLRKKAR